MIMDNKLNSFNGYLYTTIFDKPDTIATLPNSLCSTVFDFTLQKSIIYKGTAKITNGDFQFTFFVPKDIAYNYGFGKISYYAAGDTSMEFQLSFSAYFSMQMVFIQI